jgi:hypothetical protein
MNILVHDTLKEYVDLHQVTLLLEKIMLFGSSSSALSSVALEIVYIFGQFLVAPGRFQYYIPLHSAWPTWYTSVDATLLFVESFLNRYGVCLHNSIVCPVD